MRSTSKCCFLPRGRSWMWIIKKWGQMKKRKYHCPQTGTCKPMRCATPHGAGNLLSVLIRWWWSAVLIAVPGFRVCAIPACHNRCVSEGWIAFPPGEFVRLLTARNGLKTSLVLVINLYGFCKSGSLQTGWGRGTAPADLWFGNTASPHGGKVRLSGKGEIKGFSPTYAETPQLGKICVSEKNLKKYWINVAVSYVKWNPKALIRILNHMVMRIRRPTQLHFHIWCWHIKIHQFAARVVLVNLTNTITFLRCIITPHHVNINQDD